VCWSQTGGLARFLSQNNFPIPIIAYTSDARFARRMALLRGVIPIHATPPQTGRLADWNHHVDELLLRKQWVQPGDPIVMLAGKPLGTKRRSNTIAIHQVGEQEFGYHAHDS
ncbi:MAG: hypothetical protein KDA28_12840, partial [Phycisphaerales bacterium]|nr:hypothetical protein [Phycisphaerales bacterium]